MEKESVRNAEIYRLKMVENKSNSEIAKVYGISPVRVAQIIWDISESESKGRVAGLHPFPSQWEEHILINTREINVLTRKGIKTLKELTTYTIKELRGLKNAGPKSFGSLQEKLEELGYYIAGTQPEIKLRQDDIVYLLMQKLKDHATSCKKGTYNQSDPTAYEKVTSKLFLQYGFSFPIVSEDEEPELFDDFCPDPETVIIQANDCTWGINFTIKASNGKHVGYWSRESTGADGKWTGCSPEFIPVITRLFLGGTREPSENDIEDPYRREIDLNK
jgi:hypothetical protein